MTQSLSNVLLHIVFSTKHRWDIIEPTGIRRLHAYVGGTCRALGSPAIQIGGTSNHIHVGCTLPRTMTIAGLVEKIKTSSSAWMKTIGGGCKDFAWQSGYGAFSIGTSQAERLCRYIETQQEHHRKRTFEEEFLDLLHRYQVEYDERYLWD